MKKIICHLLFLCVSVAAAQESEKSELFKTLKTKDSLLFDVSFNQCDFKVLEKLIHKDLQFLHDIGGIQDYDAFFKAVRENVCGNPDRKAMRKLVPGSLKVYPLYNRGKLYGAIQMGDHEFFISENRGAFKKTSTAKFTHTWFLENGVWLLHDVLSYDHQPVE